MSATTITRPRTGAQVPRSRTATTPVQVTGILDLSDKSAYIRRYGFLPNPSDVRLQPDRLARWGLRPGDRIVATVADGKLLDVESVNGSTDWHDRPNFGDLTPIYPRERLRLETGSPTTRLIDLFAPIGKGQRGLISSPPKAGKTLVLQAIADGITRNHPEVHLMVVLIGERPEEVTELRKTIAGEVASSTFDRPDRDHVSIAELAIERAKRLVEEGQDVVVLLDSLTRLGRAYNNLAPSGGRILTGGIDAGALYPPKRFFGSARNLEEGGSLTIIASALVETGSRMDEVIFEEFKGTGNSELVLDRRLADRRIYPAIDIQRTSTRKEELLMDKDELNRVYLLRNFLADMPPVEALEFLLERMKRTKNNKEFFATMAQ